MKKDVLKGKTTLNNADDLISIVSDNLKLGELRSYEKVDIDKIQVNYNVRKTFNGIEEMANSIEKEGLIEPVIIKKQEGNNYLLIAGERRLKAYLLLHKKRGEEYSKIKALIYNTEMPEDKIETIQFIENIQREDVNPLELMKGIERFKARGQTLKQIAESIGKSEGYMKNISMTIKQIKDNPELKTILEGQHGMNKVAMADLMSTKALPNELQVKLLKDKAEGTIKSGSQLVEKVNEAKETHNIRNRPYDLNNKYKFLLKDTRVGKTTYKGRYFNQTFDIHDLNTRERDKIIDYAESLIDFLRGKRKLEMRRYGINNHNPDPIPKSTIPNPTGENHGHIR